MGAFKVYARVVAVGVIVAAMFHVLPWWFTLWAGIPLLIDGCVMLNGVIEPARKKIL